jgi:Na+/H+ antiporter NhaC
MKHFRAIGFIALIFLLSIIFIDQPVPGTGWSLVPPLIAIVLAIISGQLILSLGAAVFLGNFMFFCGQGQGVWGASLGTIQKSGAYFLSSVTDTTNLLILGFVFFILSMVHLVTLCGGLHALVIYLQRWVVGPRSAQFVTAVLGCLIFIDDYANTMIVGSTMKSLTDKYKVSREKLAFIVDATSAPIAGLALVSTWIGYEVGLFSEMSRQYQWPMDGYGVFLEALSYRYYCLIMLIFVFVNIFFNLDFGPMAKSQATQDSTQSTETTSHSSPSGSIIVAILPIGLLLYLVFALLWWDGGGWQEPHRFWSLSSWRQVLTQSQHGTAILFAASVTSYLVSLLLALFVSGVGWSGVQKAFVSGVKSAGLPVVILVLAWSVKILCDDLHTGEFVVSLLGDQLNPQWLPLLVFIIAALTAFSTGTSWGTMAILIPTVTPLALSLNGDQFGLYVALSLAAILDGAIMGDHCSPISDTTIMSSISSGCDLVSHVRTQFPYSLLVGALALVLGYLPAGNSLAMGGNGVSVPLGMILMMSLFLLVMLFFALNKRRDRGV